MTIAELLPVLVRMDLALGGGILATLAVRLPTRRWLGARAAYALWLLPLVVMIAVLAPARIVTVAAPAISVSAPASPRMEIVGESVPSGPTAPVKAPIDPALILGLVWAAGVIGAIGWFARGQVRFLKLARQGLAGPAAVGVVRPRVVIPADFETRYSRAERAAILAHEGAHIALQHPRANALAAALQALHWFNPLVHLAAHLMRIDQELACDAAVVGDRPRMRRLYAETLLKSQLSATPLPLGCYWPAGADHPLTRRVKMLSRAGPSRGLRIAGAAGVAALTLAGGIAAWAAQPARTALGPPTTATMILKQPWDDSDDPKAHTAAGQEAYAAALDRAKNLPPELAARYAKESRFAVEHDLPAPSLVGYGQQDRVAPPPTSNRVQSLEIIDPPEGTAVVADRIDVLEDGRVTVYTGHVQVWQGDRITLTQRATFRLSEAVFQSTRKNALASFEKVRAATLAARRDYAAGRISASALDEQERELKRAGADLRMTQPSAAWSEDAPSSRAERSGAAAKAPEDSMAAALAAGDWRKAAMAGAQASDVIRALQARGREKGVDPDQAVVVIALDDTVEVTPLKRLPALDDPKEGRTNGLFGSGFGFSAKPGTIILYPPEADTFGATPSVGSPPGSTTPTTSNEPLAIVPPILRPSGRQAGPQTMASMAQPPILRRTGSGSATGQAMLTPVANPSPARSPPGWRPFAAVYDGDAPVLLKGTVTSVEWTAPRVLLHIVDEESGQAWAVEGGNPNTMTAGGLTREMFAQGPRIVVRGYQAKDKACRPECLASGRDVTFPDGRKLFVGGNPAPR